MHDNLGILGGGGGETWSYISLKDSPGFCNRLEEDLYNSPSNSFPVPFILPIVSDLSIITNTIQMCLLSGEYVPLLPHCLKWIKSKLSKTPSQALCHVTQPIPASSTKHSLPWARHRYPLFTDPNFSNFFSFYQIFLKWKFTLTFLFSASSRIRHRVTIEWILVE